MTLISKQYLCKDCGFKWTDTKVNLNRPNPFLRCLRCESKNIGIPKSDTLRYRALFFLIFSFITGILGIVGGLWVRSNFVLQGEPWIYGILGFLVGFIAPALYTVHEILEH